MGYHCFKEIQELGSISQHTFPIFPHPLLIFGPTRCSSRRFLRKFQIRPLALKYGILVFWLQNTKMEIKESYLVLSMVHSPIFMKISHFLRFRNMVYSFQTSETGGWLWTTSFGVHWRFHYLISPRLDPH